jgi:DNA invertase Pin-like site-specific DNA recombinase
MGDARKRKINAIIVWRFDRFARSTKHLLLALEEFRGLGVQFISYQENIDTGTPLGQALFVIIAAIAELERGLICERVNAGIRNARAHGKRLGRPRQYVDIDRIRELQASGLSLRQVAAQLNVGYGTVRARLQSSERKTPRKSGEENVTFTEVPAGL